MNKKIELPQRVTVKAEEYIRRADCYIMTKLNISNDKDTRDKYLIATEIGLRTENDVLILCIRFAYTAQFKQDSGM